MIFGKKTKLKVVLRMVVVVRGIKPIVCMWDLGLWGGALRWGLPKGSQPVFTRFSEKATEKSEQLGEQAQPRIEPGTSHLPV